MTERVLYANDLDPGSYAVRLFAGLAGIELAITTIDITPIAEHCAPAYRSLSPDGTLPALVEGARVAVGAPSVVARLCASEPSAAAFLPETPEEIARALAWTAYAAGPAARVAEARAVALFETPGDLDALTAAARRALTALEDARVDLDFAGAPYFSGARATVPDVLLFPAVALSRDIGIDHDDFPALRAWVRRIRALPGFVTTPGVPDYA